MDKQETEKVRVIITDDHKIIRDGVRALLMSDEKVEIVGEASNGEELLDLLKNKHADVALLDINMPGKSGLELTVDLKELYPSLKVLILSMLDHESYVKKAMTSGASGYILKNAGKEELRSAIQLVATGATYISPNICLNLLQGNHSTNEHETEQAAAKDLLSKRELEVLQLISEGFTNSEIAEKLFNSKRTIETHRQNLLEKTKCKNTASLIKFAVQNGLI